MRQTKTIFCFLFQILRKTIESLLKLQKKANYQYNSSKTDISKSIGYFINHVGEMEQSKKSKFNFPREFEFSIHSSFE
jgi:hypothetical protein